MDNQMIIGIVVIVVIVTLILALWVWQSRRTLVMIKKYPDEAFDFFSSRPSLWTVFNVSSSALQPDQWPKTQGLPQGMPLGPFEFQVPRLGGRTVSVFGTTCDCMQELDQFVFRMKAKEKGQPSSACDSKTCVF